MKACERCARTADRTKIRAIQSAMLHRPVHVCRFDEECRPQPVTLANLQIIEVLPSDGGGADVVRLEQSDTRTRTRGKWEVDSVDLAIEEAGWRALCLAWRRQQDVLFRLRLSPAEGQLKVDHEMMVEVPQRRPEVV